MPPLPPLPIRVGRAVARVVSLPLLPLLSVLLLVVSSFPSFLAVGKPLPAFVFPVQAFDKPLPPFLFPRQAFLFPGLILMGGGSFFWILCDIKIAPVVERHQRMKNIEDIPG